MSVLRVALAQRAAATDRGANLEGCLEAMRAAAAEGAGLVVFPELALDRFFPQRRDDGTAQSLAEPIPGPTTERVGALARELGLVTGALGVGRADVVAIPRRPDLYTEWLG